MWTLRKVHIGRVVRYFIIIDLIFLAGWGLIRPVFSVFIVEHVEAATLTTVGIAVAIYWVLRSLLQLPIADFLDRTPGERDDFYVLVAGLLIAALAALSYIFVARPWQLYVVEVVHAVGFACYLPSWRSIFTRHLDKSHVSFDWSLDNAALGLATGASGLFGGAVAATFGFQVIFVLAAVLSFLAAMVLLLVPNLILTPKDGTRQHFFFFRRHNSGNL